MNPMRVLDLQDRPLSDCVRGLEMLKKFFDWRSGYLLCKQSKAVEKN